MTAVYIAAPRLAYPAARHLARDLAEAGHTIVSTWHTLADLDSAEETTDPAHRRELLARCLADIGRAEVMVAWTAAGTPRATIGEIVEMLRHHCRPVIWIQGPQGEGGNIWDADPLVVRVRHYTDSKNTVLRVIDLLRDIEPGASTACPSEHRGHRCEEQGAHDEHACWVEGYGTVRWPAEAG